MFTAWFLILKWWDGGGFYFTSTQATLVFFNFCTEFWGNHLKEHLLCKPDNKSVGCHWFGNPALCYFPSITCSRTIIYIKRQKPVLTENHRRWWLMEQQKDIVPLSPLLSDNIVPYVHCSIFTAVTNEDWFPSWFYCFNVSITSLK